MPLTLNDLVALAMLSDLAYEDEARTFLDLRLPNVLGGAWRRLTPEELHFTATGHPGTYTRNGQTVTVDVMGYLRFENNAGFAAVNETTRQVVMVFTGTDSAIDLATDAAIWFGALNGHLAAISQFTDAVAVYAAGRGFAALSAGHSLGGALAETLVLHDTRYVGGASIGGPGNPAFVGSTIVGNFLHIAHPADPVGGWILPSGHIGSRAIITDETYGGGYPSHKISGYEALFDILAGSSAFTGLSPTDLGGLRAFDRSKPFVGPTPTGTMFVGTPFSDTIDGSGNGLVLRIEGGGGTDNLKGGAGDDWIAGGADFDLLDGGVGADHLFGDGGSDIIIGGSGGDTLSGGGGDDTYLLNDDSSHKIVDEGSAGGFDVIALNDAGSAATPVQLRYTATATDLTINMEYPDRILVSVTIQNMHIAANQVEQLQLRDGAGNIYKVVDLVQVWSQVAAYNLFQPALDQALTFVSGTNARDLVYLNWSQLSSAVYTGAYETYGDWYLATSYDSALGKVVVAYEDVERAILVGGSGNDHLGAPWRPYYSADTFQSTIFGGGGNDYITGSRGADTLYGGDGNDNFTDWGGADVMYGGAGNDGFDMGGNNTWDVPGIAYGGPDDDTYFPHSLDDIFIEYADEGTDGITFYNFLGPPPESPRPYYLPAHIENLTVSGFGDGWFGDIHGNELANEIRTGGQSVHAGAGEDRLSTAGGPAYGGTGNDTYSIQYETDLSFIHEFAGEGDADTVMVGQRSSGFMLVLPDEVENLIHWESTLPPGTVFFDSQPFWGTGNRLANVIKGGLHEDILIGMDGADQLFGGRRKDYLDGGIGDDLLVGGGDGDVMIGGPGFDTVDYSDAPTWIFLNLATGQTGNEDAYGDTFDGIERIIGSGWGDQITGDASANIFYGGGGDDMVDGGVGGDQLYGGAGNDILRADGGGDRLEGGADADIFVFSQGAIHSYAMRSDGAKSVIADTVADFVAGVDKIDVSWFDGQPFSGGNDPFNFIGTGAFTHQVGQLRYETGGGATSIQGDMDGDGRADLHIVLAGTLTLTATDFIL